MKPIAVRQRRPLIIMIVTLGLLAFMSIGALYTRPNYYLNLSDSEPLGLYKLVPTHEFKSGDLVIVETPKSARPFVYGRGWMPRGRPLIKNVGAVAGDEVEISDQEIRINHRYVGPVFKTDSMGLPLPRLRGKFRIKPGYFLPLSTYINKSFDGRYFGQIPLTLIHGKVTPIFTF